MSMSDTRDDTSTGPNPPHDPPPRERKLPGKERPSDPVEPGPDQRNPDPGPFIEPIKDPPDEANSPPPRQASKAQMQTIDR
jgi:hypothetical protein